jgi:hypothetical protein
MDPFRTQLLAIVREPQEIFVLRKKGIIPTSINFTGSFNGPSKMSPRLAECLTLQADSEHGPSMSALAKSFQHHATSRPNGIHLRLAVVGIVLATMFTPTNAYFDQGICCMLKAREEITLFQDNPWSVCDTDHSYVYLNPGPYTSVPATMGWCEQNCGGYQRSSADEWLRPLTTWVLPAAALLLLCSLGEEEEPNKENAEEEKPSKGNGKRLSWWDRLGPWRYKAQEYIALLGDPASAICGAFSEIVMDARVLSSKRGGWFEGGMVGVSTLAGSAKFDEDALVKQLLKNVEPTASEPQYQAIKDIRELLAKNDRVEYIQKLKDLLAKNDRVKSRLHSGMTVTLKARLEFINAVFLPVMLQLVTTASSFHDAYDQNGDVETAHNLSYGVWYSWIIILAVASNSFAASVNPGVAKAAIGDLVDLSSSILPLRKRFPNAVDWGNWVRRLCGDARDDCFTTYFYHTYIGGQLFGWACVACACACASAISYTTPPTGVGCDTFAYILYGALSFVLALLVVLRHWVEKRSQAKKPSHSAWGIVDDILKVIYAVLVSLNAFVLFGSTLFHLIGLYRSCRCQALFGSSSAVLELNFFTQQAIDNATRFWLPVGYMCFSFIWVICMIAIILWAYLYHHIHTGHFPECFRADNSSRDDSEQVIYTQVTPAIQVGRPSGRAAK